jgi:BirA family transcriptional regulator, biotin operon repressor / biotin---[acetyl-CoA-carboxylase] ligase
MLEPTFDLERVRRDSFVAQVEWHATLPSTNDHALQRAAMETLDTPLLIVAEEQTAGRGRGSNRWWSGAGALTFSLVLDPARIGPLSLRTEHWPRVALTAGVALCQALVELAPHLDCGLKWPNDVLISGKKVAGILVEIPPAPPSAPRRIVLGMGVNINNSLADAPSEIKERGTALCDATGLEFDATQVLLTWLARFVENVGALAVDDPELPPRWQARCVLSGKSVELQAGERIVRGACRGIEADGALLVDTPAGPERLYGGVLVRISP